MAYGYAPIKAEFIVPHVSSSSSSGDEQHQPAAVVKEHGMNRGRDFSHLKTRSDSRICKDVALGNPCSIGESCPRIHDIDEYMSTKPADIGPICPNFSVNGHCPFGIVCRFHKHHTAADGSQIRNEELALMDPPASSSTSVPRPVVDAVRKRQYKFPRTDESAKILDAAFSSASTDAEYDVAVGPLDTQPRDYKKSIDWRGKTYLAPLTTVGNLPFRRLCKDFGVDITCGEMALSEKILQGSLSEIALLKRHSSEDIFGVQLCGSQSDLMMRCVEYVSNEVDADFIDLNLGCPLDAVYRKGNGSGLLHRPRKLEKTLTGMTIVSSIPVTCKIRTGLQRNKNIAHNLLPIIKRTGVSLCTLHGRSRDQRYTRSADWDYIDQCGGIARDLSLPFFGNGDVLSYEHYVEHMRSNIDGVMIGRPALMKPWIFDEIKRGRHWDISSSERFDIMKTYCNYGLEHWGSDDEGVNKTRRFLLEWHSFHYRYIPVGLLEVLPPNINDRPPKYFGRDDLETLMASDDVKDWLKLSDMLLGPAPESFKFLPKHKSNSYPDPSEIVKT
eukprot:Partr_v1_DN27102_c4_g1_i2_m15474 putative Catalyzes the synthesis of dihydrouridine, a modified base found in the D-loop of most tRNAs